MNLSSYQLLWLFFVYSFFGWLLETSIAAAKQKHFVSRGVINSPFCVTYGIGAVLITQNLGELQGFWLFLGIFLFTSALQWIAGHVIEKLYHEKWWDYSHIRWNLAGYICLPYSLLWTLLGLLAMKWGNSLLGSLYGKLPPLAGKILIWVLIGILFLDITATLIISSGKSKRTKRSAELSRNPSVFASGCDFYKVVMLFFIGAFLGDITETIFCRITAGVWMSRSSVVWGPFSIVWGLAIAAATALLYRFRNASDSFLFLVGTLIGGAYEYLCSVFTEIVFGTVFWDYSEIPFNLGGRINLLYCFFWGIAAVVWLKKLYPIVSRLIEKLPMKFGKLLTWCLILFMICNAAVSCLALTRYNERAHGIAATQDWQETMDERFDDERMEKIYPNALTVE